MQYWEQAFTEEGHEDDEQTFRRPKKHPKAYYYCPECKMQECSCIEIHSNNRVFFTLGDFEVYLQSSKEGAIVSFEMRFNSKNNIQEMTYKDRINIIVGVKLVPTIIDKLNSYITKGYRTHQQLAWIFYNLNILSTRIESYK